MAHRDVALSLVQDLLAAPGSEQGWRAFLIHLCDAVGGSGANFISHDFNSQRGHVSVTARTPPEAIVLYHEYWSQYDEWARKGAHLAAGTVVTGDQLVERAAFERTPFCNDFGRHFDVWQCLDGVIEASPAAMSVLSVNADKRRSRFDAQDAALILTLMPSLRRALQIHRRLAGAELMAAGAMDVLDRLNDGVVLLSSRAAVLSTNRMAEQILRESDGLSLVRRELHGSTPEITNRIRAAIEQAVRASQGLALENQRTVLAVPRPSGERALSLIMAPLPARQTPLSETGAVVVMFLTDPKRQVVAEAETIQAIFGLSAGEANMVRCLSAGFSLEETARHLGLRIDTVRKRLKLVFEKTDTHRQSELIRLVLASIGAALGT